MAGAGFALGRRFQPDLKSVTRLSFYILSPCLVFTALTHAELSGAEFGQMAGFTLLVNGAMLALTLLVGLGLRLKRQILATLIIAAVFVNGGNYGLAVIKFAFGEAALSRAVVYYVVSTLLVYSVGVLVASAGKRPLRQAILQGLTLPSTYALLLAGLLRFTGWQAPLAVDRAVALLSQAAIPVMLIVLGLQMAEMKTWPHHHWALIGVAVFLQLIIAPLLGVGLAALLGLDGVTRQAAVLETAMPTAVITTVLAVEYDLDGPFMTGVVILSTLLSPLTVTPLIAYLLG